MRLFARRLLTRERESGLDEPDVRERLREVADEALSLGVVLLRDEPEVVAEGQQPLVELDRLVAPSLLRENRDEPERAWQEDALARRQSVDVDVLVIGSVPLDEAVAQ